MAFINGAVVREGLGNSKFTKGQRVRVKPLSWFYEKCTDIECNSFGNRFVFYGKLTKLTIDIDFLKCLIDADLAVSQVYFSGDGRPPVYTVVDLNRNSTGTMFCTTFFTENMLEPVDK